MPPVSFFVFPGSHITLVLMATAGWHESWGSEESARALLHGKGKGWAPGGPTTHKL